VLAACCEFISSWEQRIVAWPYTDIAFSATLPLWRDGKEHTFQTLIVLNKVNSNVARSNMTDVATMVMEE
jgi:hypothetical protein